MQFSDSDLNSFLTAIGQTCIVNGTELTGIFRNPYKTIDVYSGQLASSLPTLLIKTELASEITYDTPVIIAGSDYRVNEIQAEQSGFTRLTLSKDN